MSGLRTSSGLLRDPRRKLLIVNGVARGNDEKVVLYAQQLGLNTCWAALTFNKKKVRKMIPAGETLCMVISLGYGETQGHPHKGKSLYDVIDVKGGMPEWFVGGVE